LYFGFMPQKPALQKQEVQPALQKQEGQPASQRPPNALVQSESMLQTHDAAERQAIR
jgi:hypothetical protein